MKICKISMYITLFPLEY